MKPTKKYGKALWKQIQDGGKEITKTRKPIRHASTKRAKELAQYRKCRELFLQVNPFCQACWTSKATDIHHRFGRVGKLLNYTPLWMGVCRQCHDWIGSNPTQARINGWVAPIGQWNNQSLVK